MTESTSPNRPTWQAEQEYPQLCEELRQGLRNVKDPELGMDVIQLGLIRDVTIDADHVQIHMILTTPFCPYAGNMIESTRQNAEEALKRQVSIDLGMEAWDFSMMEDGLGDSWGLYY